MDVTTIVVGQMQANCYIVSDPKTKDAIIIDPGDDAEHIVQTVQEKKYRVVSIVATHGHFDHIMGALHVELVLSVPFCVHKDDAFLLTQMASSARHFLGIEAGPAPAANTFLKEGDTVSFGEYSLCVMETPGHTPGSMCLYSKEENLVFAGDLIFADGGVGRTDFSYSDKTKLNASLRRILSLSPKTRIYPGHGDPTTVAKERMLLANIPYGVE